LKIFAELRLPELSDQRARLIPLRLGCILIAILGRRVLSGIRGGSASLLTTAGGGGGGPPATGARVDKMRRGRRGPLPPPTMTKSYPEPSSNADSVVEIVPGPYWPVDALVVTQPIDDQSGLMLNLNQNIYKAGILRTNT